MMEHRKGVFVFAGIILVTLVTSGCGERAETGPAEKVKAGDVRQVRVSPVQASPPMGSIEYVGVLAAHTKATVSSEMSGTIERLHFEKGDRVRKGQVLAEISTSTMRLQVRKAEAAVAVARCALEKAETGSRPEEILIAEAVLRESGAALHEAERNYSRVKNLHDSNATSKSEYDSATRALDMARARVESARQQLSLARQGPRSEDRRAARANLGQAEAALALAKDWLSKSILRSPCNGIIAFREVEEGEVIVVPPVTILTQVVDPERLRIRLSISEKDIRVLSEKKEFQFTVDAIPGKTFPCKLAFRAPAADPATRSFPVEFEVANPVPPMADGMTARLRLPVIDGGRGPKVPSAWLSEENGKIGLFVLREGKALFREVTLGAYYDQRVEVLSGLAANETVITNPAGLKSGQKVKY